MLEKMTQVSTDAIVPVDKYNSLVAEYNRLIERHKVYTSALNEDIASRDSKIKRLEKEIEGRKECYTALKELMDTKYISIDEHNKIVNSYTDEHNNTVDALNKENERLNRYTTNVDKVNHDLVTKVTLLESENEELKKKNFDDFKRRDNDIINQAKRICELEEKVDRQRENLNAINKTIEIKTKENYRLITVKNSQEKEIEAHESENARLTEKIMELKKERDKYMARVNDLRMELDCVKASKEKHEEAARDKVVEDLRESFNYWRTKFLTAQEEVERLKVENKNIRKEIEKLVNEGDDGREGFKRYIKYIIGEEEGKFKEELNKRFSEEVSKISMERTEEELAKAKESEIKGVGRTSSGRYPWGAKIIRCEKPDNFHCMYGDDCPVEAAEKCKFAKEENNIPCGEDAIE